MTDLQKLQIRASEIRQRLGELNTVDEPTPEQSKELDELGGEFVRLEPRIRAALITHSEAEAEASAAPAPVDAEARERRELRGKARVGDFLRAFLNGAPVDGASAEYRDASGLLGCSIPLDLFEPLGGRPAAEAVERRAVTPAPGTTPVVSRPVQPYIYSRGAAAYLGVDMVSVGPGNASFPVLSTKTPATAVAAGGAASATAAAFTATSLSPTRISGQFEIQKETAAVFPQIEDALRRDIPLAVADDLDRQIVSGNNTGANLNGLLKQITDPTAETTRETFARHVIKAAALVDGVHAYTLRDVRQLVGISTYADAAGLIQSNTAVSAAAYLAAETGGLRAAATGWLAAPASNIQQGLARLGMAPMAACVALWGGVELIRDEYSDAGKGQVKITACQLVSDPVILYGAAFKQTNFKLA